MVRCTYRNEVRNMFNTLQQLKEFSETLGLYAFIEEPYDYPIYLGICVDEGKDTDIYVYMDGGVAYMSNTGDHSILETKGLDTITKLVTQINSYQIRKLIK